MLQIVGASTTRAGPLLKIGRRGMLSRKRPGVRADGKAAILPAADAKKIDLPDDPGGRGKLQVLTGVNAGDRPACSGDVRGATSTGGGNGGGVASDGDALA